MAGIKSKINVLFNTFFISHLQYVHFVNGFLVPYKNHDFYPSS